VVAPQAATVTAEADTAAAIAQPSRARRPAVNFAHCRIASYVYSRSLSGVNEIRAFAGNWPILASACPEPFVIRP
jgi:hypothetical protein